MFLCLSPEYRFIKARLKAARTSSPDRELFKTIIETRISNFLDDNRNRIVDEIKADVISPDEFIFQNIEVIAFNELSSGTHHFYRGSLNHTGKSILAIWEWATEQLQGNSVWTARNYEDQKKRLQKEISSCG
jgi:hypothetical protein